MPKKTLSVARVLREVTRTYEHVIDKAALKVARAAWKNAREETRPARMTRANAGRMTRANAGEIRDRAYSIIDEWAMAPAATGPIVETVDSFLNTTNLGFVLIGSSVDPAKSQARAVARMAMRYDIAREAGAYVGGLYEQAVEKAK